MTWEIVEDHNAERAHRYTIYLDTGDDRIEIATGPTSVDVRAEALLAMETAYEDLCRWAVVDRVIERLDSDRVVPDRATGAWDALTPAEYAAKYADRAPWPRPKGGYR